MKLKEIENLNCSCCGSTDQNRQWWNRDRGFGICKKCVPFVRDGYVKDYQEEGLKEFERAHGIEGIHFNIDEQIYFSKIRDWEEGEKLPSSNGYLELPNKEYPLRDIEEDNDGFNVEFYFSGRWIKGMNIDFE